MTIIIPEIAKYEGYKITFFCVTLILQTLWAGPRYLPVRWQGSLTLSESISFSKNRQILLLLKPSLSFSVWMISF